MTVLQVLEVDITTLDVDVIVNAANETLLGGGGVDGAIHRASGPQLFEEMPDPWWMKPNSLKDIIFRHVISSIQLGLSGPNTLLKDVMKLLLNCYINSLRICIKKELQVIAFPAISTGVYGFPAERAARLVIKGVADFYATHPEIEKIIFCCFGGESKRLHETALASIK